MTNFPDEFTYLPYTDQEALQESLEEAQHIGGEQNPYCLGNSGVEDKQFVIWSNANGL